MLQWGRGSRSAETRICGGLLAVTLCFNGAADRDPRRLEHTTHMVGRAPASMGPRIEIRGDVAAHQSRTTRCRASMGPRIEIRGDDLRRILAYRPVQASMGPRIEIRGDLRHVCSDGRYPKRASMGPRIEIRGDLLWERDWKLGQPASMGPRIEIRGDARRWT